MAIFNSYVSHYQRVNQWPSSKWLSAERSFCWCLILTCDSFPQEQLLLPISVQKWIQDRFQGRNRASFSWRSTFTHHFQGDPPETAKKTPRQWRPALLGSTHPGTWKIPSTCHWQPRQPLDIAGYLGEKGAVKQHIWTIFQDGSPQIRKSHAARLSEKSICLEKMRKVEKFLQMAAVEASATPPFDPSAAIWKGIPGSGWIRCADLLRNSGGHSRRQRGRKA